MSTDNLQTNQAATVKRGAPDSGRYFRCMSDFVGFTADDEAAIVRTKPIIEKHLPSIVARFYAHLLRYPPTRKFFLKPDGSLDEVYVQLRMRHLTNFWLRTASGNYDDEYASYVDYVGRAHTTRGADPTIYIPERYVIGQVGFIQHAISQVLTHELSDVDEVFEDRAVEAWSKLLMVILEILARAYGTERQPETYDPLVPVDGSAVRRLAQQAFELEMGEHPLVVTKWVTVARTSDIPAGERKIVQVGALSIGVFHHNGQYYALVNSCLHRGGPVCTGPLEGEILTCPWHGFQYDLRDGRLLVDPSAHLDVFPVRVENGEIQIEVPQP